MSETLEIGMPRKVLTLAMMMGAHGDCLVSSYDGCCSVCRDFLNTAFEVTYEPSGVRPLGEVLDELWDDMQGDRANG